MTQPLNGTYPPRTENCDTHEDRMDKIDSDINKGKGWLMAVGGLWTVGVLLVGWMGSNINMKLTNIEQLLNSDKSDIRILNEQMKNIQIDVREIQDRHREQDKMLRSMSESRNGK